MQSRKASLNLPQCWRLDLASPGQTLVFASRQRELPHIVYCGDALPPKEDLRLLADCARRPLTPGTLDQIAPLSMLPEEGRGFPGQPGLQLCDVEGKPALTQFELTKTNVIDNGVVFVCHDRHFGLELKLHLVCPSGERVLKISTTLHNAGDTDWQVSWLSVPVMPIDQEMRRIIEFFGRWTQEFSPVSVPITRGVHLRENRRGRTGFDHFPALICTEEYASFTRGRVAAIHYALSSVHKMFVEELPDGRRQVQSGIAEMQRLGNGQTIHSGTAYWAFSNRGLNGLSHDFQRFVRNQLIQFPEPTRPRPIHYNSWEAVYFDHKVDVLKELADRAAEVGAERFVLDDGWFGGDEYRRNDDTAGLGDWFVDREKYPDGLHPLIDHVESLGMTFGLWIEPEMVNLDSTLARLHPDWVMTHGKGSQIEGRRQHALDLTNQAVTDYLYERIDWLLSNHSIDYLKWDMNRDLSRPVDAQGMPLLVRQAEALRALLQRVREEHTAVEIESCASGGGRIDYDVLRHTHRVWLSDSNDAHNRWQMQNQAFLFLPPEIVGSHVGPARCHTSGRKLSMSFRALVAMTGHMGIEMDLRELDANETATLKRYLRLFKESRHWLHSGFQYRLDSPSSEQLAQIIVAKTGDRFFLFAGTLAVPRNETTAPIKLAGLDSDASYRVKLINTDDIDPLATRSFDSPLIDSNGVVLSGALLMQAGITPPFPMPDTMWLFAGETV